MATKLPRLPLNIPLFVVRDNKGYASPEFQRWWQAFAEGIEARLGAVELALLQDAIDTVSAAVITVEAGVLAVESATADAQAAADTAQTSANAVQTNVDAIADTAALTNSYSDAVVTGTAAGATASIIISSHTRYYADGTSVSVTGTTLTGLAYDTAYYIYYDDLARAGGAVTYHATTNPLTGQYDANTGRHVAGTAITPATSLDPNIIGASPFPIGVIPEIFIAA